MSPHILDEKGDASVASQILEDAKRRLAAVESGGGLERGVKPEEQYKLRGPHGRRTINEEILADAMAEVSGRAAGASDIPHLAEKIPFYGQVEQGMNTYDLLKASQRLSKGQGSIEDLSTVQSHLARQQQPKTLGYEVADIVANLPAYGIEFAAGGEVFERVAATAAGRAVTAAAELAAARLAETAVVRHIEKGLAAVAERGILGGAVERAAGAQAYAGAEAGLGRMATEALTRTVAKTAVQTAAMPGRVLAAAVNRDLSGKFGIDEAGQTVITASIPDLLESLPAGVIDEFMENLGEHSGHMIGHLPGVEAVNLFATRLVGAASKQLGIPASALVKKIAEHTGWHGVIPEMGEEYFTNALKAAALGDPWSDVIPGKEALPMAIGFAVPGVTARAVEYGANLLSRVPTTDTTPIPSTPQGVTPQPGAPAAPAVTGAVPPETAPVAVPEAPGGALGAAPSVPTPAENVQERPRTSNIVQDVLQANVQAGHLTAEEAVGAKIVAPRTEEDQILVDETRARGIDVFLVDAGKPLRIPAGYGDRAIALDANATPGSRRFAVVLHEWAHALGDIVPGKWEELEQLIKTHLPDVYAESQRRYARRSAVTRGQALTPEVARNEAVSNSLENIGGFVLFAYTDPGAAVRLATYNPGMFARGLHSLVTALNTVAGTRFRTQHMGDLERLDRTIGGTILNTPGGRAVGKLPKARVLQIALKVRELIDSMVGTPLIERSRAPEGRPAEAPTPTQSVQLQPPRQTGEPFAGEIPPNLSPGPTLEAPTHEDVRGNLPGGAQRPSAEGVQATGGERQAPERGRRGGENGERSGVELLPANAPAEAVSEGLHGERPAGQPGPERGEGVSHGGPNDLGAGRAGATDDELSAIFDKEVEAAFKPPEEPKATFKKGLIIPTRAGIVTQEVNEKGEPVGERKPVTPQLPSASELYKAEKEKGFQAPPKEADRIREEFRSKGAAWLARLSNHIKHRYAVKYMAWMYGTGAYPRDLPENMPYQTAQGVRLALESFAKDVGFPIPETPARAPLGPLVITPIFGGPSRELPGTAEPGYVEKTQPQLPSATELFKTEAQRKREAKAAKPAEPRAGAAALPGQAPGFAEGEAFRRLNLYLHKYLSHRMQKDHTATNLDADTIGGILAFETINASPLRTHLMRLVREAGLDADYLLAAAYARAKGKPSPPKIAEPPAPKSEVDKAGDDLDALFAIPEREKRTAAQISYEYNTVNRELSEAMDKGDRGTARAALQAIDRLLTEAHVAGIEIQADQFTLDYREKLSKQIRRLGREAVRGFDRSRFAGEAPTLDDGIRTALEAEDNLGFDTAAEAANAILKHPDWRERWEASANLAREVESWKKRLEARRRKPPLFAIDEDKYQKARPAFLTLAKNLGQDAKDPATLVRAIITWLRDVRAYTAERIQGIKEYVIRFAKEFLNEKPDEKPKLTKKAAAQKAILNYRITPEDEIGAGGAKAKARGNIEAIKILKQLRAESRPATIEEQKKLVKYVGWGASELAQGAFPVYRAKEGWEDIAAELKSLLTPDEWSGAAASTRNAHYTSEEIVRGMWSLLEHFGFRHGNMLEPGTGVGHFLGLVPDSLAKKVQFTGVELDPTSAGIAHALYPAADIRNEGFEQFVAPKGFYDAAIGNPPFAADKVRSDSEYKHMGLALHDFFFVKTLDRVRPGGIVMFVTSRYTMDKKDDRARAEIQKRADLIGAVRLPQTAFKENAGTEVVTDILFLKRRGEDEKQGGEDWSQLSSFEQGPRSAAINEYFVTHPEKVLGSHSFTGSLYGKQEYSVSPPLDKTIGQAFRDATADLPRNVYRETAKKPSPRSKQKQKAVAFAPAAGKPGAFVIDKGKVFVNEGTQAVSYDTGKLDSDRIKSFVPVRDALLELLALQNSDIEADLAPLQAKLKKSYDAFTAKHGRIGEYRTLGRTNKKTGERFEQRKLTNYLAFRADPDAPLVLSLETWDEDGNVTLAPVFEKRTIRPKIIPDVKSASDALAVVLNSHGEPNVAEIARLANMTEAAVLEELGPRLYRDPEANAWALSEEYLSGPVRRKLKIAEGAAKSDGRYERNVEALKAVRPADIPPSKIRARLGATWIEPDDVTLFMREAMSLSSKVVHEPLTGTWSVADARGSSADLTQKWGTPYARADWILERGLNNAPVTIWSRDADGKRSVDAEATKLAEGKRGEIQEAFQKWVWEDGERATRLARVYNDTHNDWVRTKWDGSHLTFEGMSSAFKLHKHQRDVVWRIIRRGTTYMAHGVGAGKTLAMAAAAMEMRRLGLVTKPLVIVPNQMLLQFSNETLAAYPGAKLMVADEDQFEKENRRRFVSRVATGDWDMVVMTHSAFGKVGVDPERLAEKMRLLIAEYEEALKATDEEMSRKVLEKRKKRLVERLDKLTHQPKDQGVNFEKLGVDFLFVDEAHEFRKLDIQTNMGTVKGVTTEGSARSFNLKAAVEYLEQMNPGRATVFASGTPITNTMGELYTVQRFLQEKGLKEAGLASFDAWVSTFADLTTQPEMGPTGKYKLQTRLAAFANLPELSKLVSEFMDVVFVEDLPYITRPKIEGGARQIEIAPEALRQAELMQQLEHRIEHRDKRTEGHLILTAMTDGRFTAVDMRFGVTTLADWKPDTDSDPDNKLNRMIAAVHDTYKRTTGVEIEDPNTGEKFKANLTQMIFSNIGVPGSEEKRGFSAYGWIKSELIRLGVKPGEIAIMHDYDTSEKRRALFREMNAGKKRILIGGKGMETGVNAQRLLYALHHLDPSWFPSTVEQREGRILRQGNFNKEIQIKVWATKGSLDTTMWQLNETKHKFIQAFFRGDESVREMTDIGAEEGSFAMMKAMTSGNPLVLEKVNLEGTLARLGTLRQGWVDEQQRALSSVAMLDQTIPGLRKRIEDVEASIKKRVMPAKASELVATFEGQQLSGEALQKAIDKWTGEAQARGEQAVLKGVKTATKGIFSKQDYYTEHVPIEAAAGYQADLNLQVEKSHAAGMVDQYLDGTLKGIGNANVRVETVSLQGLFNALQRWDAALLQEQQDLAARLADRAKYEALIGQPFKYAEEYERTVAQLSAVDAQLLATDNKQAGPAAPTVEPGQILYAIPEEDVKRIRRFAKKAQKQGERSTIGTTPSKIASTSEEPIHRAFQRGVREVRGEGEVVRAHDKVREEARKRLQVDYEGEKRDLVAKVRSGSALTDTETMMLDQIQRDAGAKWLGTKDKAGYAEAAELNWLYQDARRDVARALGAIRDVLTPVEKLVRAITTPGRAARDQIDRLRKLAKSLPAGDPRLARVRARLIKLLEREAERAQKALEEAKKIGLDPELVTDDYFKDPSLWGRLVRIVNDGKVNGWDWYMEWTYASMLTTPVTQLANITGNVSMTIYDVWMRRTAEAMANTVIRDKNSPTWKENAQFFRATIPAFGKAGRAFLRAFATELPLYEMELAERGVATGPGGFKGEGFGPAIPGPIGRAIRFPSLTALLAFDEFSKVLTTEMEATALAYRKAVSDGERDPVRAIERMREDNFVEIHNQALDVATRSVLQDDTPLVRWALSSRNKLNNIIPVPIGSILFRFVRFPIRAFQVGLGIPFKPIQAAGRLVTGKYRGDRRAQVVDLAQTALSLGITAAVMSLVHGGGDPEKPLITGSAPSNTGERMLAQATAPPMSFRVGSTYYSYARIDPFAITLATIVDLANAVRDAQNSNKEDAATAALSKLFGSVVGQARDKTFLQTLGQIIKAVEEPESREPAKLARDLFITPMIPRIIPAAIAASDPYSRPDTIRKYEDQGVWTRAAVSAWERAMPVGENVPPPRFDLWGRPIKKPGRSWVAHLFSPTQVTSEAQDVAQLDVLIARYNDRLNSGAIKDPTAKPFFPKPPDYWYEAKGVTHYWDDTQYAELAQRAGEAAAAKLSKRRLHWENPGPDDVDEIKSALSDARSKVKREILRGKH